MCHLAGSTAAAGCWAGHLGSWAEVYSQLAGEPGRPARVYSQLGGDRAGHQLGRGQGRAGERAGAQAGGQGRAGGKSSSLSGLSGTYFVSKFLPYGQMARAKHSVYLE